MDVVGAIKSFFANAHMYHARNCTNVTLIPKISCPTKPSQFRPIACCNVLYKLISKLLMLRLQGVGDIIDQARDGFIPNKQLIENVVLATELVKGYERDSMTPKCMVKIDLREVYDYVEWSFLQSMLLNIGIP